MLGTIVNTLTIAIGSAIGAAFGEKMLVRFKARLFDAIGLCALLLGVNAFVQNMPKSQFPVLFIVSMALGTIAGRKMNFSEKFSNFIDKKSKNANSENPLSQGLPTGILLYCIGTFSMLGPVMSALQGDNTYLFTNATLDLVTSAVLAATYGWGMILAAPVLFLWQTMFFLVAKFSESAISADLMTELAIVGGIMITASGLAILKIKDCKTLDMLPALLVPPAFFLLRWAYAFLAV